MPVFAVARKLVDRGRYAGSAGIAIVAQPAEGLERVVERVAERWDVRRGDWQYRPTENFENELRQLLGSNPRDDADAFPEVWRAALDDLLAQGLPCGRGTYGGWDDGDMRLGQLAWCLARHLRPAFVVETGVARGLTTRVILEALDRNGGGWLWSIDLPPLIEGRLRKETAAAVPARLRGRWRLLTGSSRHRLPELLRVLGRVDLFVHDSMHTTRNVRFELDHIWPFLNPGGAVLVDDVERNRATADFLRSHEDAHGFVCRAEDGGALIGVILKQAAA